MNKVYCINCNDEVTTNKNEEWEKHTIKNEELEVKVIKEYCDLCGEVAESDGTFAENQKRIREAYWEKTGIITQNQIRKLLEKYDVGAQPLSKLLGWGDFTIQRYLSGQLPSKTYSDALKTLFDSENMKALVLKEGDKISPLAKRKLLSKLNMNMQPALMVDVQEVVNYCLNTVNNLKVTNMSLNKILYYIQGWHLVFFNRKLFNVKFEAWQYGPVIRDVYMRFSDYGKSELAKHSIQGEFDFTEEQKELIDTILYAYGEFSGIKLASMSHQEEPWIEAIDKFGEKNKGSIADSTIERYFNRMKETFLIETIEQIKTAAQMCAIFDDEIKKSKVLH